MARRGLLAELLHQVKVAEREQAKLEREAERARKAATREAERLRKAGERVTAKRARTDVAEQKRRAKEAKAAHIAAREAEAESKNLELAQYFEEIDLLLAATLDVDDFVDLEALKKTADNPSYANLYLEKPIPTPDPVPPFSPPPPPTGIKGLFGKGKYEKELAEARELNDAKVGRWKKEIEKHAAQESKRVQDLEKDKAKYSEKCEARELEVKQHNEAIDKLIADLGYGVVDAVQEYVLIVLSNSLYPDGFPVSHNFEFEPETAELKLRVSIPNPDNISDVAAFKYNKSADEIGERKLTQKACKDRYARAVHQVALRSIHEVFEADRRGLIKTISLELGTETTEPATGIYGFILFVATGAERESFIQFDLANVVPLATLNHIGASVSKNPFGLEAAVSSGIRKS